MNIRATSSLGLSLSCDSAWLLGFEYLNHLGQELGYIGAMGRMGEFEVKQ